MQHHHTLRMGQAIVSIVQCPSCHHFVVGGDMIWLRPPRPPADLGDAQHCRFCEADTTKPSDGTIRA